MGRNFIVAEIDGSTLAASFIASLQWGRNFIVAEMRVAFLVHGEAIFVLQWGHNFIVAEIIP